MKRDSYATANRFRARWGYRMMRIVHADEYARVEAEPESEDLDAEFRAAIKAGVLGKALRVKEAAPIAGMNERTLYDHVHLFGERCGGTWRIYEYDPRWKAFLDQKGKSRRGKRRGDNCNTDGGGND